MMVRRGCKAQKEVSLCRCPCSDHIVGNDDDDDDDDDDDLDDDANEGVQGRDSGQLVPMSL